MSQENPGNPEGNPPQKPGDVFSQQFQHPSVSARVPDKVRTGVFATGALVQDSPDEFCVDFLQAMAQPRQVAARVILTPGMMNQFINAVRDNLKKYEQQFGPPPVLPKPPQDRRPTIQEIYDELKLPDEMLSGTYANAVMIGHSPAEFFFDFITRFYPTASVSSRVYVSAPQVPRLLETLNMAMGQYQKRIANMRNQAGPQGEQGHEGGPPQGV